MNALDNFVLTSATSYLQSVVFVDDQIYDSHDKPTAISMIPSTLGRGLRSQFSKEADDDAAAAQDTNSEAIDLMVPSATDISVAPPYHPRELVESFARKGIACALYEPKKGFTTDDTSELFRLCERADVIILDWDLYNDDGDSVSALMAELIAKSESALPHHVRLCALYTARPSLHPVLDTLLAKLTARSCVVSVIDGRLQLASGATRISILGKPHSAGRPPDDAAYIVKESELADRIIKEFAELHKGLMPAFALHGLASIRRNTKRFLDKFTPQLDGSFLLHRALVLGDADAFDELPDLLSDEIRAVLADMWPKKSDIAEVTKATIEGLPLTKSKRNWTTSQGVALDQSSIFRRLLLEGEQGFRDSLKGSNQIEELKGKGFREIDPKLLKDFEAILAADGKSWNEQLATLFCSRTQYGKEGRQLRFGTVVRHRSSTQDAWSYSLCLMPICDSQRLNPAKEICFPFWRLRNDVKCGSPSKRHGITIVIENQTLSFAAGGKIRDMLWTASFRPGSDGWVVASDGNVFGIASPTVEWISELKPLHAQRIAAHVGVEISRVGLVESEWLRLFCDR